MPVEIRELIIRAVVQETKKPGEGGAAPANAPDAEQIIDECVRQILKILKAKGEM